MAATGPMAYSRDGEYFAYCSPDGTLKLWEIRSGAVKQEYTPSSHLSATCSCMSWAPVRQPLKTPRKRRKSGSGAAHNVVDLLALGTMEGSVLLYSLAKGDLHTQLSDGHRDKVHSVCWTEDGSALYSCGADQHIVHWCLMKGTVKFKWKADKGDVYSIAVCSSQRHLLSAGRTIKLWDLDTHKVLQTFPGHASEVFRLLPVPSQAGAAADSVRQNTYFLSAAVGDRLIHVWCTSSSDKHRNAVASFALPDEPCQLTVRAQEQSIHLAAVTKQGQLLIFKHVLNGPGRKPLEPQATIQIATTDEIPKPVSILGTHLCDDDAQSVLFCHGSFLQLTFEKLRAKMCENNVCLVRQDPTHSVMSTEGAVSKVRTPGVSDSVKVLVPSMLQPAAPTRTEDKEAYEKKKRKKSGSGELSLDERLNAISLDKPGEKAATQPPRADTLATLLAQGVQSNDKKIINSVLQHTDDHIIRRTVRRLPVPVIVPLVKILSQRMHGHAQSGHTIIKWVKNVLAIHTSYLMTFPELLSALSGMYNMMDSRVLLFGRLSKLQGKLDLMLSQITSQTGEEEDVVSAQQPLLIYQDESSDEDIEADDIIPDQSESEDNWELQLETSDEEEEEMEDEEELEDDDDDDDDNGDEDGDVVEVDQNGEGESDMDDCD